MRSLLAGAMLALAFAVPAAADVPGSIAVPDGNKVFLSGHATGVQIYGCVASAWVLEGPRAEVVDKQGHLLLTHYAGPTWEARDGSTVVGRREAGVNVDPTAIDWLRLAAASTSGDRLGRTTYVQRINTVGGRAPAGACEAGARVEVPYEADYVFWKAAGGR